MKSAVEAGFIRGDAQGIKVEAKTPEDVAVKIREYQVAGWIWIGGTSRWSLFLLGTQPVFYLV